MQQLPLSQRCRWCRAHSRSTTRIDQCHVSATSGTSCFVPRATFTDAEQEVVDGALLDRLAPATDGAGNPLFETDADGNLILDAVGNPIPVMVTIPVPALMSVNGPHGSARFFAPFAAVGSHEAYLEPAELRLIAEWLDIGAQYYNNPLDVPQN